MAEESTKKPEINEIATAAKDIDIFAGWLKRLENPDPVLRSEASGKGIKLYDEVARDAHAAAVLQTRYLAVIGKEWNIEAAEGSRRGTLQRAITTGSKEQDIADFVKQCFLSCNFDQARQEVLRAILYGFYCAEIMWEYTPHPGPLPQGARGKKNGPLPQGARGKIGIKKLLAKHPRRFCFTPERELRLLTLSSMIYGEPVPDRKFIQFSYGSSDNPYGEGLGQKLWWPVWFKKNGIKFWVIFAEKFGSPTAVGKYPSGTIKSDQDKLLEAAEAIQQETAIVIPDNMLVELLEAARTSTINTYEALCNYMDAQISKAVLGHKAAADTTPGKLGNEEQAGDIRAEIVKADADALCECINSTLIPWLVDYNFGPQEEYPKMWIRTDPEQDLKALAERDKILIRDIGGLEVPVSYIRETYNVPAPEEGEDVLTSPMPTFPGIPQFAESGRGTLQRARTGGRNDRGTSQRAPTFAEMTPEAEIAMEAQRQRMVSRYMSEVQKSFAGMRQGALDEIEELLLKSGTMQWEEFSSGIQNILQQYYGGAADDIGKVVEMAMEPIYRYYRITDKTAWGGGFPNVSFGFDSVDRATLAAMNRIDTAYLSKYIENQDMQGPVMKFLKEQYTEKGEGLFGRGSSEGINAFRQQFGDELAGLEDWQIRRILDTSVTRMRSYADVRQAVEAGVNMKIYVTRGERACDICRPKHGEIIAAQGMQESMDAAARKPEVFGTFNEVPPFHPNCVCRLIMDV